MGNGKGNDILTLVQIFFFCACVIQSMEVYPFHSGTCHLIKSRVVLNRSYY